MDRALNYSMKKKIRTKKIPLWFPSDRKNESAFGPSLEEPNEGTYLPAFVSCIITYAILFASVIAQIVVHCVVKVDKVDAVIDIWLELVERHMHLVFVLNAILELAAHAHVEHREGLGPDLFRQEEILVETETV